MKSFQKQLVQWLAFASLISFSFSCNQKESTLKTQQSDSVSNRHPVTQESRPRVAANSKNAVRVALDSSNKFDWNTFRQKFHDSASIEIDPSDEVAVGPWVNWNEFEYQRVYSYVNDTLWIQTFYRSPDSAATTKNQSTVLLNSQDPDYVQFGPLWSDMLTRGHHLTDSLK